MLLYVKLTFMTKLERFDIKYENKTKEQHYIAVKNRHFSSLNIYLQNDKSNNLEI